MTTVFYHGHGSLHFVTNANQVIYVDPYAGSGYEKEADLVLFTHRHFDHCDLSKLTLREDTPIIYPETLHPEIDTYNKVQFGDMLIEACEAYNKNHKKEECVGYMLYVDNLKIYLAGDTSTTNQMATMKDVDYAFIPTDGHYNMGIEEAKEVTKLIKAKKTVPIHMKPGELFDENVAKSFIDNEFLIIFPNMVQEL